MPLRVNWQSMLVEFTSFLSCTETQMASLVSVEFLVRVQMSVFLIRGRSILEAARGYRLEPESGETLVQYRTGHVRRRRRPIVRESFSNSSNSSSSSSQA